MVISEIEPFLDYYGKVRKRTLRVVESIPKEHFDRSPVPGKFSFADVIRHLAAIERHMYAENVRGRPSLYRGCGPELADGYDDVRRFLDRCHAESIEIFAALTPEELQKKCTTPAGTPITVWKWLRCLPEHEIHHRGQLYTYLALLGHAAPPMYGMTSEQVAAAAVEETKG